MISARYYFFGILAFSLLFTACKAGKESVKTDTKAPGNILTDRISSYKTMEFEQYFYEGIKERDNDNYQRAAQQFEKAVDLLPNNGAAHYELARCYMRMGQVANAEAAAQIAVKSDGENKWYVVFLADVYQQEKKWSQAATLYNQLMTKYPSEPDFYVNLAAIYVQQNKIADAMKVYDLMEKQFGANENINLQKYKIYYQLGKYEKAIEEINKLIATYPQDLRFKQLLADTYNKSGQGDKAINVYNDILKDNPQDGNTQLAVAQYYFERGEREKGYDMLKIAFANPSVPIDQKISILYTYFLTKDLPSEDNKKQAYILVDELVKTHPDDAKSHAIYGDFLYLDKKYVEARKEYQKSLQYRDDVFAVWQQLFYIDAESNNYQNLVDDAAKALEVFPSQPIIYFFSGVAKSELKKYQESVEDLQAGLYLIQDNKPLEIQFYLNLAEAFNNLKNYTKSNSAFEQALTLDPSNALALNNYAYYLSVRNEDLDKAEEMSKKSLSKEPNNSSYLDTYGWILYKRGKYKDAAEYVKRSLNNDSGNATVAEHYGDILYKLGDIDGAVSWWKKAKQLGAVSEKLDRQINDKKIYE